MTARTRICWKLDELPYIAAIDAGSGAGGGVLESAVFLATHQPQVLIQLPGYESTTGQPVSEERLLEHFTRPVGDDPSISVLSGAVGSGKSHMVRWLYAKCEGIDGWHRVYVEKAATSLRGVLHTILEGMTGPVVNDLREKLASVSVKVSSLEESKTLIAQQLAFRMQFPTRPNQELGRYERMAREHLAVMLGDPVLSQHLLRDGGAIHRISRIAFEGLSGDDDADRDLEFSEEDLPLEAADLARAAAPTQNAVRDFHSSKRLRVAALKALNEELPEAKKAVFIGSGVNLLEVFEEVRQTLGTQGKELVLFVEDLVVLHGIDRELAQAFTVVRNRAKGRCGMRVVIAVTDGYLSSEFETLKTRATHFSLNLDLRDSTQVPTETSVDFVGRYFNALRLGREAIARQYVHADRDEQWFGNACSDCEERTECHEVFGVDGGGRGLYPLNSTAIDRLITLLPRKTFDPREIIRHVIAEPLELAARELPAESFPSNRFAASIDMKRVLVDPDYRAKLASSEAGQRQLSVVAYWDDQNRPNRSAIFEAFGLRPTNPDTGSGREGDDLEGKRDRTRSDRQPKVFNEIDAWANDSRTLTAGTAREIRTFIYKSLLEHIRGGSFGLRVMKGPRNDSVYVGGIVVDLLSVRIPLASGGGAEVKREFELEFDHSDATAGVLKAIVATRQTGNWPVDRIEALARLTTEFDKAVDRIASLSKELREDLGPAVMLLSSLDQVRGSSLTTQGELMESMLREPTGFGEAPEWADWGRTAKAAHSASFGFLERYAMGAKGDGATSFVDGAELLAKLGRSRKSRQLGEPFKGSTDFIDLQRRTLDVQKRSGERLWKKVDQQLAAFDGFIEPGVKWGPLQERVRAALQHAKNDGLLPLADAFSQMEQLAAAVPETSIESYYTLLKLRADEDRSIFDLMPDRSDELGRLHSYCSFVDSLFTAVEEKLDTEARPEVAEVSAVSTAHSLQNLADQLDAFPGGAK